jgi:hypothetical protein
MIPWPNSTWHRVATNFLVAVIFFELAPTAPVQAQQAIPDELSRLENTVGLQGGGSLLDRLSRLEIKIFGQSRSGSMFDRLKALQDAIGLSSAPQPSPTPPITPVYQPPGPAVPLNTPVNGPIVPINSPANPQPSALTAAPREASAERLERVRNLINTAQVSRLSLTANTYPPHFFRILQPNESDSSDFLEQVSAASKNKVFRFNKFPVPIYITVPPDPIYSSSVMAACADWERRTNGMVRFQAVSNKDNARIQVTWSHLGDKSEVKDCTLGAHTVTKWTSKGPGKVTLMSVGAIPVPLFIPNLGPKYTVPPQEIEVNLDMIDHKYKEARYLLLRNIIAHELGHALGLLGHSPNNNDMMFNITDEYSRISERDLNTLNKLYQKKTDIPL